MSNGPPDSTDDVPSRSPRLGRSSARQATAALRGPVRAVAFWSAALLPVAYVPLLLVGLDSRRRAATFSVLIFAHVVALFLGKSHRTE
jgi:hypothetical protein